MNIEVVFIKKFRNKVPGDVANVKLGFARNYLIPKGYAVVATGYNLRVINSVIERKKKELEAKLERLKKIVKELNMKEFVFNLRSEGDKVFGSVTKNKILKEIRKLIPEFESSWLQLEHPLKEFKSFEIPFVINKAEGIEGKIVVKVERI